MRFADSVFSSTEKKKKRKKEKKEKRKSETIRQKFPTYIIIIIILLLLLYCYYPCRSFHSFNASLSSILASFNIPLRARNKFVERRKCASSPAACCSRKFESIGIRFSSTRQRRFRKAIFSKPSTSTVSLPPFPLERVNRRGMRTCDYPSNSRSYF